MKIELLGHLADIRPVSICAVLIYCSFYTAEIGFKDCRKGLKGDAIANEIRQLRVSTLKAFIKQKGECYSPSFRNAFKSKSD